MIYLCQGCFDWLKIDETVSYSKVDYPYKHKCSYCNSSDHNYEIMTETTAYFTEKFIKKMFQNMYRLEETIQGLENRIYNLENPKYRY